MTKAACLAAAALVCACGGDSTRVTPSTTRPSSTAATTPRLTVAPTEAPSLPPPSANPNEPVGFPLDPSLFTDAVVGEPGSRAIAVGAGPSVRDVSALRQVSDDAALANANGWNCRVHQEYEGAPAVDWYVQPGTPVFATMDGEATLFINAYVNAFDFYSVDREPYIGDPDRSRAPTTPFPGPGGGMGVYIAIVSTTHGAVYGHLELDATIATAPVGAFRGGFSHSFDYRATFATPRRFDVADQVAVWQVKRGDMIGYTGDAGYSEAPHLHYAITRRSDGAALCPTEEAGFADNGWLFR